jgi:hypothetical protein
LLYEPCVKNRVAEAASQSARSGDRNLLDRFHGFTAANQFTAAGLFNFNHISTDVAPKHFAYLVGFHHFQSPF